jgi:hypothetical protein
MTPVVQRHARAWLLLTAALALHVADEAAHDFLGFYNPFVMMLRDVTLILWLPTFEFTEWITGLVAAIVILLLLTRFARRGARWMAWLSLPYGLVMLVNALMHIAGSLYWQRQVPGVWSAPILLAASAWLLITAAARLRS